ncbi:nuclear transport factor 2 family protein [Chryseoglobus sp. 28M-23]|uniref:nuclear transport factor 2 family protein n=1 Tax=Chryseoglobus sp. 28M-23 TaxID=2772253 RepID=UPI001746C663|nr:nuclear transport factor 2 family protein [Chryseoglobus sp. 28M-23]QOD93592.1 nuclear transport factor 2 family protein [Chryseoglobus sp. 28M-23]
MTAITDDLPAQLIRQEHDGWEALCRGEGGTHYHHAMTEDAVMIVDTGVIERGAVLAALEGSPWDSYELSEQRVVRLGDRAAILVYRARAVRGDDVVDRRMSTTYVYQEGRWRTAAHQQTPVV